MLYGQRVKLAHELYFAAVEYGGGTFTKEAKKFDGDSGYVVGGKAPGLEIHVEDQGVLATVQDIQVWIDRTNSHFYGSWLSEGVLYIDAVNIVDSLSEALNMGKFYDQQAIFDLASKEDIPVS